MGEIILFKKPEQQTKPISISGASDDIACCALGCGQPADMCLEYVDVATGSTVFEHFCAKHLRKEGYK